jgi:hypothetical protein
MTNLVHVLKMAGTRIDKIISKKVPEMNDNELAPYIYSTLERAKKANELHQFHAAKELNRVIDQLTSQGRKKAEKRFPTEPPTPTEK